MPTHRPLPSLLLATLSFTLAPAVATAASPAPTTLTWPQFRGPQRSGSTNASGLAAAWPASGPPELWRKAVGSGFATVVSDGGRAYTAMASGEDEVVVAFDARSGLELWRTAVGTPTRSEFGDGPRATPTLDGGRVYTVTSTSRLVALDAKNGKLLWAQDLTAYDPTPRFGYSVSPLVVDGMVIVDIGTKDLVDAAAAEAQKKAAAEAAATGATAPPPPPPAPAPGAAAAADPNAPPPPPPPVGSIAAFDAATGALRWRAGFAGPAGYSSPVLAEIGGVRQLLYSRGTSLAALGLDGAVLWRHTTPQRSAIALPLVLSDGVVFISSADDSFGAMAVAVERNADGTWHTEEVWSERLMRNHFNSSVRVGDTVYGFDNGTFRALDARRGEKRWAQRGFGKGSLLAAGELLYVLGDDGTLALVRATPDAYREAGRVQAMTGKAWTSPSLANGVLFVRDHDELVAYDVSAAAIAALPAPAAAPAATSPSGVNAAADAAALAAAEALPVEEILARHARARGGVERWRALRSLELSGTYRAFSETSPFTLVRQRGSDATGDRFRLDYALAAGAAVRAQGPDGPWVQHPFLDAPAIRIDTTPEMRAYRAQLLREARFEPLLVDAAKSGVKVEKIGRGEVNGKTTLDLKVTLPPAPGEEKPSEETWHLDPTTFLDLAVDSELFDYTQGDQPFKQRAFHADFREVDGVVIPFRVDLEFNARYEGMTVDSARAGGAVDAARFAAPPPPPPAPAAAPGG